MVHTCRMAVSFVLADRVHVLLSARVVKTPKKRVTLQDMDAAESHEGSTRIQLFVPGWYSAAPMF